MHNTDCNKIRMLYRLYCYRAFGYDYIKDEKSLSIKKDNLTKNLDKMRNIVANCHLCPLAKTRKNTVFGEGNKQAKIMFIGEGPGASEDETGRPFVGRAGELLTKMIENVLLVKRDEVYIANIVKCRPPGNRVPALEEASACKPYLLAQIEVINPKVIVTLGSTSFHHLSERYEDKITKIRGQVLNFENRTLIPTFHPSFLLRNPSAKKEAYLDMLKIKGYL